MPIIRTPLPLRLPITEGFCMDAKLRSTFETLGRCSSGCRLGIVGSADCARARGLFFRRFPADALRPPAAAAQHQHAPRTTAAVSSSSSSSSSSRSSSSSSGIEKARLLPEGDFASDDIIRTILTTAVSVIGMTVAMVA